jgi:hypothetical protein
MSSRLSARRSAIPIVSDMIAPAGVPACAIAAREVLPPHTYVEHRTHEGRGRKEIVRCLMRHLARRLYPLLLADLGENPGRVDVAAAP